MKGPVSVANGAWGGLTDLQNKAQKTLDPDGTALPGVKAGKFFPTPGTLKLYRTGSIDPDLEAYKVNPAVQSLKVGTAF